MEILKGLIALICLILIGLDIYKVFIKNEENDLLTIIILILICIKNMI